MKTAIKVSNPQTSTWSDFQKSAISKPQLSTIKGGDTNIIIEELIEG